MSGYSYTRYADATTKSIGRLLYYLDNYCPLWITEHVVFNSTGGDVNVSFYGEPFASVTWEADGAPRFEFHGEHKTYAKNQDEYREPTMRREQEYTAQRLRGRS